MQLLWSSIFTRNTNVLFSTFWVFFISAFSCRTLVCQVLNLSRNMRIIKRKILQVFIYIGPPMQDNERAKKDIGEKSLHTVRISKGKNEFRSFKRYSVLCSGPMTINWKKYLSLKLYFEYLKFYLTHCFKKKCPISTKYTFKQIYKIMFD